MPAPMMTHFALAGHVCRSSPAGSGASLSRCSAWASSCACHHRSRDISLPYHEPITQRTGLSRDPPDDRARSNSPPVPSSATTCCSSNSASGAHRFVRRCSGWCATSSSPSSPAGACTCRASTSRELSTLYETRAILEPYVMRLACARGGAADWDAMAAALDRATAEQHADELLEIDRECREIVWAAADNRFLTDTLDMLYAQSDRLWHLYLADVAAARSRDRRAPRDPRGAGRRRRRPRRGVDRVAHARLRRQDRRRRPPPPGIPPRRLLTAAADPTDGAVGAEPRRDGTTMSVSAEMSNVCSVC